MMRVVVRSRHQRSCHLFAVLLVLCSILALNKAETEAAADAAVPVSGDSLSHSSSKCDENDVECHEKAKYLKDENNNATLSSSSKWDKYLRLIREAKANYVACESTNCSCYNRQLELDLKPWKTNGISRQLIKEAAKSAERLVHYQIIDGHLYRNDEEMFPFRNSGVEHFLKRVAAKLTVNTEFLLNTRDWPQTHKWHKQPYPIFSFSKVTKEHDDIMYPAWTFWEGGPAVWPIYPSGLGRWDEQMKIIPREAKKWPWSKKEPKAFFRGSRTSAERDPLVLLSREQPHLVDAQYTKNQAWRSDADTLGAKPAEEIKLEDHCKYKYLFNFRGVAASFRLKHLFLCNSLVFHVGDEWLEFFYDALKPWIHYIPVEPSLRDARELIEFAVANDNVAKQIAAAGRRFITEHLTMDDVACYWDQLIVEYTKLLTYKPKLNKKFKRLV